MLIKAKDVRKKFGNVSTMTIHRWLKKGFPPPTKVMGRNFWTTEQVENDIPAWIAAHTEHDVPQEVHLPVTCDFLDLLHPDGTKKEVIYEHYWRMYQETGDVEPLAEACERAPFFGQPEMAKEIAKKLRSFRVNNKYQVAMDRMALDKLVSIYAKELGSNNAAYEQIARTEQFKYHQGENKGRPKSAASLKDEHLAYKRSQK